MKRRKILGIANTAAIGFTIVPGNVLGKKFGYVAPSDKLNIPGLSTKW